MKNPPAANPPSLNHSDRRYRLLWFLAAGSLLVILMAILFPRKVNNPPNPSATDAPQSAPISLPATPARNRLFARPPAFAEPAPSASEIVSNKVAQFARSRRRLAHAMADHFKNAVPEEFERLFDAAEAGRYEEMETIYQSLRKQRENGTDKSWYGPQWRAITETVGVAETAHDWPEQ